MPAPSKCDLSPPAIQELVATLLGEWEQQRSLQRDGEWSRTKLDKPASAARSAIQRVSKLLAEESRSDFDQIFDDCSAELKRAVGLRATSVNSDFCVGPDPESWARFCDFVDERCARWRRETSGLAEQAFRGVIGEHFPSAEMSATNMPMGTAPSVPDDPGVSRLLHAHTAPIRTVDCCDTAVAFGNYARSNFGTIGILSTAVAVTLGSAVAAGGIKELSAGFLVSAILASLLLAGRMVRRQRERATRSAIINHTQTVHSQARSELQRALERQRRSIERWIASRSDAALVTIDAIKADQLRPRHKQVEEEYNAQMSGSRARMAAILAELIQRTTMEAGELPLRRPPGGCIAHARLRSARRPGLVAGRR